jgi:hypothetical protein
MYVSRSWGNDEDNAGRPLLGFGTDSVVHAHRPTRTRSSNHTYHMADTRRAVLSIPYSQLQRGSHIVVMICAAMWSELAV